MNSWVEDELKYLNLGDLRRETRFKKIVSTLAEKPEASIPQACGNWADTKATYDFFSSRRVKTKALMEAHQKATLERIEPHSTILAIQDTTELNYTTHPATKGLGYLETQKSLGLKVHSVFCSTPTGVPLGLIYQDVWIRDPEEFGKKHQRKNKNTEDKESKKWLDALKVTEEVIPKHTTVVTVADREADIYDLFTSFSREESYFLIRATQDRKISEESQYLYSAIACAPCLGEMILDLQKTPSRAKRTAILSLRHTKVTIEPPKHRAKRSTLPTVPVEVIWAVEENPPQGTEAVEWLLVTNLKVTSYEDILRYLHWYSLRWLIERYHFVLKSGCRIEELQLKSATSLTRALATYSIVAWRLLWLTYLARTEPSTPCTLILQTHEWQALYCTVHRTPTPPELPPSLKDCVLWLAKLGGFLARKGDKDPGVVTIWRGLRRLEDIASTWLLLRSSS